MSEMFRGSLFETTPVPMLLEDWSAIKKALSGLVASGIHDIAAHLAARPEMLARMRASRTYVDANRAALRLLAAESKEHLFRMLASLSPQDMGPDSRVMRALAAGEGSAQGERSIQTLNGRKLIILWQVDLSSPLADRLLFTATDITELRATQQALLETRGKLAQNARVTLLGELAASISHEVAQPLNAIGLQAESGRRWLLKEGPDIGRARHSLEEIGRNAARAGAMVRRTRELLRRGSTRPRPIDVQSLLTDVTAFVQHEANVHGITLTVEAAKGLPFILGDKPQLDQVLLNLMLNAIQAVVSSGERQRVVEILASMPEKNHITIEVRDSGPGLSQEQLDRAFEPFFSTKANGIGLGLSICRSIVSAHGGSIKAANHALGASFLVRLEACPVGTP